MFNTESLTRINSRNIEAYTPKYAVDIILPYIPKDEVIWCPFSLRHHNFCWYLRSLGYMVFNTHYNPDTWEWDDFLNFNPEFHFDIILDNPPFKWKTKFVEKALSFWKPFAFFLPVQSISDNWIPSLFIKNKKDMELLIPDKRTEFGNQEQKWISFKTIYICNWVLPKQIIFCKLNKTYENL